MHILCNYKLFSFCPVPVSCAAQPTGFVWRTGENLDDVTTLFSQNLGAISKLF